MEINCMKRVMVETSSVPVPGKNADAKSRSNINELNHDCLAKILMYLPILQRLEIEKVCKKWNEASEFSWYGVKKIDFDELMITLDKREEILEMIMIRCCEYLTNLTMSGYQYTWMSNVLKNNCQNMTHFSIDKNNRREFEISNDDLVSIIISMTKLQYLKITMNRDGASDPFNQMVDKLPMDVKEIHLIVPNLMVTHFDKTAPVLNKFNGLRCLSLHGFCLTNATLEGILQNKNTLAELDLTKCKFPPRALPIFSNLQKLERLILWKVKDFKEDEIDTITHNCSKLKHFECLKIGRNGRPEKIPYRIFCGLEFLKLEHLDFDGIDFNSDGRNKISELATNWKQLRYFNAEGGRNFSVSDFREITTFKNLEFLDLRKADINSESFINIATNCLELKELTMPFENISGIALEKLTNLKKLEKLDFYDCDKLVGELLSKIANNCTKLVDLNIFGCHNVTEASLIQAGKLQHLKRLVMDHIGDIPNAMFEELNNLEYLSCCNCPSVADEGIMKVLDNCQKLSSLHVWGTGITVKTLVQASKRQRVFKPLEIYVDKSVKNDFTENTSTISPYLIIHA